MIAALAVALAIELAVWGWSLLRKDASLADLAWGPIFIAIAAAVHTSWLAFVLVELWGARLALHLAWRARGHGEDRRYAAMRAHHGARFWWVSLFTVFGLQAVLATLVSLPLHATRDAIGVREGVGAALVVAGIVVETVADLQLARWKRPGEVVDRGLWAWTRHPNYLGECIVWWGFGILGFAWWTLIGPAPMTFLLVRVSGVPMLERTIAERRPDYADYVRRVPEFWPRRPR